MRDIELGDEAEPLAPELDGTSDRGSEVAAVPFRLTRRGGIGEDVVGIRRQLTSLISTREINEYARWCCVVRRRRKIEPAALLWAVVLGFAAGGKRSLAKMRRAYETSTSIQIVPSVFYDRFTKSLAELFRTIVGVLLERVELARPNDRNDPRVSLIFLSQLS